MPWWVSFLGGMIVGAALALTAIDAWLWASLERQELEHRRQRLEATADRHRLLHD